MRPRLRAAQGTRNESQRHREQLLRLRRPQRDGSGKEVRRLRSAVRVSSMGLRVALILLGLSLVLFVGIRLARIAGTRIIASGRAPNGVEFFVVQRFNWDLGERFTT